MNRKTLVLLSVVVLVLAALVVVKQTGQKEVSIIEQAKLTTLAPSDLKAADILRLEVYNGSKPEEKVILQRTASSEPWRVTSHFNAPASKETLDKYLTSLFDLKGDAREEGATDDRLAKYELKDDQAFHVLAYKAAEGGDAAYHVLVGKSEGMSTVFLRKSGENTVFEEKADLRRDAGVYDKETAPTASTWLNKQITKVEEGKELSRVAFTLPDKQLVFERREKAQPAPAAPATPEPAPAASSEQPAEAAPAAPEAAPAAPKEYEWVVASGGPGVPHKSTSLDNILRKLKDLSARDIVDPAKKEEYGLDAPAFKTEFTIEGGETIVLEGARKDKSGNGYVRVASSQDDIVYQLDSYTFEQVFPKCGTLFDLPKFGGDLKLDELSRVEIGQEDGSRVVVEKADGKWNVTEPAADLKVQENTLSTLASTLTSWTAADYADATADTGAFNRTVTVFAGDQSRSFSVAGDSKSVDGMYVRTAEGQPILVMSRTDSKKLLLTPRDVYQLTPLEVTEATTSKVDARVGDKQVVLEKAGEEWQIVADGKHYTTDSAIASSLVTKCATFQARGIRADQTALAGDTFAVLQVTGTDGQAHTLTFGAEQDGEHLLFVSGKSHALTASKMDVDTIGNLIGTVLEKKAAESVEDAANAAAAAAAAAAPAPESAPGDAAQTPALAPSPEAAAPAEATPAADAAPAIEVMPAPAAQQ